MIEGLIGFALRQRFIVLALALLLTVMGVVSFRNLPIEAYPDVGDVRAEIITLWPGQAAEEVERLITMPVEEEMNGIAAHDRRCAPSPSTALVQCAWCSPTEPTDYFARQQVFERIPNREMPDGVTRLGVAPVHRPRRLIYRYVLESQEHSPMELEEDRGLGGGAARIRSRARGGGRISGVGGLSMQYEMHRGSRARRGRRASPCRGVVDVAQRQQRQRGRRATISQGECQFYYVRGLGRLSTPDGHRAASC